MPTLTNYQTNRIRAYAVLHYDGISSVLDINRLSLTYAVNSIPFGNVWLSLGREVRSGLAATIHHIVDKLSITLPIEIYAEVLPGPNSYGFAIEYWPTGPFRLFAGIITATGYTLSRESTSLVVSVSNWLSNMSFSSALTRGSHTLTPQQMSSAAAFGAGTGISPSFFSTTAAGEYFTPANIQEDMWGLSLAPWLKVVCQQEILDDAGDAFIEPNTDAVSAIGWFEPFIYGRYRFGCPLSLPIAGLPGSESIASAIGEDIGLETFESFASSTLWDKLIGGFAANYRFSVIPLVSTALVVPAVAGMRAPWQVIYGEEYNSIDLSAQVPRPMKGVRLFTGTSSPTGALAGLGGSPGAVPELGGSYENPDFPHGMMRFENAPRWSANAASPPAFGLAGAMPFGVRGGAMFPGAGPAPVIDPALVVAGITNLWDAYARSVYVSEALRGRTGVIQGKFRIDIAPGSTVEVRCVQDKFVRRQTGNTVSDIMYGEVNTLTINLDSDNMSASTVFQLQNLRNFKENAKDSTSILRHPMYDKVWNGAPLVEDNNLIPTPNPVFV